MPVPAYGSGSAHKHHGGVKVEPDLPQFPQSVSNRTRAYRYSTDLLRYPVYAWLAAGTTHPALGHHTTPGSMVRYYHHHHHPGIPYIQTTHMSNSVTKVLSSSLFALPLTHAAIHTWGVIAGFVEESFQDLHCSCFFSLVLATLAVPHQHHP